MLLVLLGTSGDSLAVHRRMPFTTKDQDNDPHGGENCANKFKGAWWYKNCHRSNLNGLYLRGNHFSYANGVNWKDWKRISLLFNENRDENKTSGFLNCHVYGTTMIQYQLNQKNECLDQVYSACNNHS